METISFDPTVAIYLAFTCACFIGMGYLTHRLHLWLEKNHNYAVELRDLGEQETRDGLSAFLAKHNVQGDADIRDGKVYAPVPPDRLEPLAILFINAASYYARLANPAACGLYVRDQSGQYTPLGDLDLDHIVDAARVMQRVAEDRRKSRSLYKGMTDDEIRAMVRAGLSQAFKAQSNFESANAVMRGDWDNHPEFQRTQAVLELVFKVKGARND